MFTNISISSDNAILLENAAYLGVAGTILFGPVPAFCSVVTHIALAKLNPTYERQKQWFPLNAMTFQHIKDYWETSPRLFTFQAITGIALAVLGLSYKHGLSLLVKSALSNPGTAVVLFVQICVIIPIAEEVFFRGFVQEKIRDLQKLFSSDVDTQKNRRWRVVIQALAFGASHYNSKFGINNISMVGFSAIFGYYAGMLKERSYHNSSSEGLLKNTAFHIHLNTSTLARIAFFGV